MSIEEQVRNEIREAIHKLDIVKLIREELSSSLGSPAPKKTTKAKKTAKVKQPQEPVPVSAPTKPEEVPPFEKEETVTPPATAMGSTEFLLSDLKI